MCLCIFSDNREKSYDNRAVIYFLFKAFYFSVHLGWSAGAVWHIPQCLQQKQGQNETAVPGRHPEPYGVQEKGETDVSGRVDSCRW